MDHENITSINEILPSDIYIRDVFDKHGYEATVQYLDNYIKSCEQGEYYIAEFSTPSGPCTRQEFIEHIVSKVTDPTRILEVRVSAEPMDSQERRPSQKLNDLLETNDLFELLQEIITHDVDGPSVPDVYIHEDMMMETYRQYINMVKEQARSRRLKEQIARRFAYHVAEWYHLKYNYTKPDNVFSAKMYYIMKYAQMKALMPDLPRFRSLLTHVDNTDEWTREWLQSEDGSSLGGGICSTNDHN